VFTTRQKTSRETAEIFLSICKNVNNIQIFPKNDFSSKCSYGLLKCSSNNTPKKFQDKRLKSFAQCPKLLKKYKHFFRNIFLWTRKMLFWQPCLKIFRQIVEVFLIDIRKKLKKNNFSKKMFLLICSLWTRSMHLWQPCQKVLQKDWKLFIQCPKQTRKKTFSNFLSPSKCSNGHVKCSFDNSPEIYRQKTEIFCSRSEIVEKIQLFGKNDFSSKCYYGRVKCSFDNPAAILSDKKLKFVAQCPKMKEKNIVFLRKLYYRNVFYVRVVCSCDNPAEKICKKAEIFSINVRKRL